MADLVPIDVSANGTVTSVGVDSDGSWLIQQSQDVEHIIEQNKQLQTLEPRILKSDWYHWFACVPHQIHMKWTQESGLRLFSKEYNEYAYKKLHDPDYRHFRVLLGNYK